MKSSLKLALSFFAALCAAPFASAQVSVLVHDFTAFESPNTFFIGDWELNGDAGGTNSPRASFSQGAGFYNFVGGSNDISAAALHFFDTPLDISGLTLLEVSAQILAGNAAELFKITLIDSIGIGAEAIFSATVFTSAGFFTATGNLTFDPLFDQTSVVGFQISGTAVGGVDALNLAVNQVSIVAVPEPSTYGAIAAVMLVGVALLRRKRA